ncbi:MAG: FtsW/RodA/SpoVE family cell cycle protein [Clostridia bacterium]|nr:FtsW/RodA/SpoVE family cell cycle protein [Clostridia bacterium]
MAKRKAQVKNINNSFDFLLFITVLLLLALGITMVLSASSPTSLAITGSSYTYVLKQLLSAAIGIIAMLILSKIDYKIYSKFYKIAYIAAILVLLLVLVPGLGRTVNGARRWINVPIVSSFQPSELTKIGLIVFYAFYLTKHKDELKSIGKGFIKPLLILAPVILVLLIIQSHFSASVIIILVISTMMLVAGSRLGHFLTFGAVGGGAGIGLMYILAKQFNIGIFRLKRITAFLNPWSDAQDSGWQIIQSLYAIGSGGLFGVGLRRQQTKIFIHIRATQ